MTAADCRVAPRSIEGQGMYYDKPFPLALVNDAPWATLPATLDWATRSSEMLSQAAADHGVVLIRGLPLRTAEDFDAFVLALGFRNFPYAESLSNAVRINRTERVFSANEAPPDVTIFLHHEMAQTPIYPSRLLFFCEQPADSGGATPVCRSDVLFQRLTEHCPEFAHACETRGLKYTNVMPSDNDFASGMGRSWRSTLRAANHAEAEQRLQTLGYTWQWLPDDSLRATTPALPAVRSLPDGRRSFFNQLIAAFQGWKDSRNDPSRSITFGDGQPLDRESVLRAVQFADELTFDVAWQQGDVALVDNFVAMHGRRTFTGTRKVLASLIASD